MCRRRNSRCRASRYKEDAQLRNFVSGLLERVRAIPGVAAAGASNALPFTDRNNASAMAIEGYNAASGELPPVPRWSTIDAGYLPAMKIPVARGALLPRERYGGIGKGRHCGRVPGAEILSAGQGDRRPRAPRHRGQRLALHGDWRRGQRQERRHGGPGAARRGVLELQADAAEHHARGGEDCRERYAGGGGRAAGTQAGRPRVAALRREIDAGARDGLGERP